MLTILGLRVIINSLKLSMKTYKTMWELTRMNASIVMIILKDKTFSENPPNFATSSEEEIVASVMSNVGSVIKCHLPASMEITAVEEAIVGFLITIPLTLLLVGLVNGGKVAAIDSVTSTMEVPLSILNFLPK